VWILQFAFRHNVLSDSSNDAVMNNFFRALIAGYGAKKLGGGCLGTVVVFIIIWVALGQCSWTKIDESKPETQEIHLKNAVRTCIPSHSIEITMAA
jgi:hypothetical protein